MDTKDIRNYNVGQSDYSKHKIQPWDLWLYMADGWRCDIVKRLLRTKECDGRKMDLEKIEHVLLKIKDLLEKNYVFLERQEKPELVLVEEAIKDRNLGELEASILKRTLYDSPQSMESIEESLADIRKAMKNLYM